MKNGYQVIGIFTLIFFSFFFTKNTSLVIKNMDDLMVEITNNIDSYNVNAIDSKIVNDTIIPGISGKEVDVYKTYDKMKRLGYFNPEMIQYKLVKPNISIYDNYDKYIISGNSKKNMVSIIFLLDKNDPIDDLLTLLQKYQVSVDFFVNQSFAEFNKKKVTLLKNNNYNLGYYGNELNNIKFNHSYCLLEKKNQNYLDYCASTYSFTIYSNNIVKTNLLIETKKNIKSGQFIIIDLTNNNIKEIPALIVYVKSKGYDIENLYNHLKEWKFLIDFCFFL